MRDNESMAFALGLGLGALLGTGGWWLWFVLVRLAAGALG